MFGEIVQRSDYNSTSTFEWRITEFCFCCPKSYTSPNFNFEVDDNKYTWYLKIRNTYDISSGRREYYTDLELNLCTDLTDEKFNITLQFSIRKPRGSLLNTQECSGILTAQDKTINIKGFISKAKHESYRKATPCDLIPNSTLTIVGEVVSEITLLSNNPELISILRDLKLLLNDEKFSDLLLVVEEQEIRVHKGILAARSPVFLAMLSSDMAEKQNGKIEIADIDYETMKQLLLYIYTGKVENNELAIKLLGPAEKYALEGLKKFCVDVLSRTLTVENIIKILQMAELYSVSDLKTKALDFMAENIVEIAQTDDFQPILKHNSL